MVVQEIFSLLVKLFALYTSFTGNLFWLHIPDWGRVVLFAVTLIAFIMFFLSGHRSSFNRGEYSESGRVISGIHNILVLLIFIGLAIVTMIGLLSL